jgi:hypothetical protein
MRAQGAIGDSWRHRVNIPVRQRSWPREGRGIRDGSDLEIFYLLDAATPNTGTMPGVGNAMLWWNTSGVQFTDVTGDATGARTARDATDVIGTLQNTSLITAVANLNSQQWGHRRYVSRPLAAQTISAGGTWTFSLAALESNTSHNGVMGLGVYPWRPSTGALVGTGFAGLQASLTATGQTAYSVTSTWKNGSSLLDGDILVFDVLDIFTQSMSSAYTSQFAYNGTTEASTTSCASFVSPPAALTLFTAAAAGIPDVGMGLRVT